MTNKKQVMTITLLASIALSLGAFGVITTFDQTPQSPTAIKQTPETTKLYGPSGIGSFIDTEPTVIKEKTNLMIKGTIIGIENFYEHWNEDAKAVSENNADVRATISITNYIVKVDKVIKGQYDNDTVTIRSLFGTHVDYQKGDTVIAMLTNGDNGTIMPYAGPYGMYKIQNGKAIGHEKILPEQDLLNKK
jgi:hypothetical protein